MKPSKAQTFAMALAIYRGSDGTLRGSDHADTITDATVAALKRKGWASAKFYDDARAWRWWWFTVNDAARALPEVQAEIASMRAIDGARSRANIAADDTP